jgi:glutamate synthase domain-containing protein 2
MIPQSHLPRDFQPVVDRERCARCKRCVMGCGFNALAFENGVVAGPQPCVACGRCMAFCPERAITIVETPRAYRAHDAWPPQMRKKLLQQAETGGVLLTGMGNDRPYGVIWDHLLLDACQVTNPSIDPLREPMELKTFLGRKPDALEFEKGPDGQPRLKTEMPPQIELDAPIIFAPMSFGSISLNAQKSLAMAAVKCNILWATGEGGLHEDLREYAHRAVVQCASGRFGVDPEYLNAAAAVEIKIGQGAKPGVGGHLPGEKVSAQISETRMVPLGSDCLSPAPHHDIYSIEDLKQLIYALKEVTEYRVPISVKIAAVHNVAAIASGIVRAGADIVYIDGFRGGTGAAPAVIRDHIGIPIELALAAVDDRLRAEGIRHQASLIAAGTVRCSADVAKAIALGADAVAIGTAALIALGCTVCQQCFTGNCSWGITTQKPELTRRLDPMVRSEMAANLIHAWSEEIKEILGAMGVNAIESLRGSRERLRVLGVDPALQQILGVKYAGQG